MSINITLKNKDGIVLKTQDTLCREDIVIIPDSSILGDEINLQDKTITVNGAITADEGYDGLGTVTVAVPDTIPNLQDKTETITANGTTTITSDAGYDGLNSVSVTVNVEESGTTYETYDGATSKPFTVTITNEGIASAGLFVLNTDTVPEETRAALLEDSSIYLGWVSVSRTRTVICYGGYLCLHANTVANMTGGNSIDSGAYISECNITAGTASIVTESGTKAKILKIESDCSITCSVST